MSRRAATKTLLLISALMLGVILLVAIVGAVGMAVIANMTDGTEKYSGVKLEAARNVLAFDRGMGHPFRSFTKVHVDIVEPSPQGLDQQGKPLRCTDDPNEIQYYSVTIRHVWIYGLTYRKTEYRV